MQLDFLFIPKSMALLSKASIFFFFFLFPNRISPNLECHTRVLSAYLAAKRSGEGEGVHTSLIELIEANW